MHLASIQAPNVKPYVGWTPCREWCYVHCTNEWTYEGEGVFWFESEQEHLAFMLKWAYDN